MVGWLVDERGIEPHVNLIDKAERTDGAFSRSDFVFDPESNLYVYPGGKELRKYHRAFAKRRDGLTKDGTMIDFARKHDCAACAMAMIQRFGDVTVGSSRRGTQRALAAGRSDHRPPFLVLIAGYGD